MLIGTDIAEISRFENKREVFLKKCFTDKELPLFTGKNSACRIAANFAAKEAFSKALGTGVRGFALTDISVLRDDLGKPYFEFENNVKEILLKIGAEGAEVSLSHDGGMAVAVVVIERNSKAKAFYSIAEKTMTDDKGIISYDYVKASICPRRKDVHKGDCGRIFVAGGSKGLTGAAIFACKAALKAGGGLITLACAESLNTIFEASLHEVMTYPLKDNGESITADNADAIIERANSSSVLLFGCGLSNSKDTREILKKILRQVCVPVVIDADGINALSKNINILKDANAPITLTPHIGEFSRLTGLPAEEIVANKEKYAKEFASKWGVTLVLKSEQTIVARADGTTVKNILGNPGMATGGTGDALAGVIASFIGQGIENGAECGVYIHSLAGDLAAADKGEYGVTPTDLTENIPYALKGLM